MDTFSTLLFIVASLFSQKYETQTLKKQAKIEAQQIARLEENFVRLEKEMAHNSQVKQPVATSINRIANLLNNPYIKTALVAGIAIYVWEKYKNSKQHTGSKKEQTL